jgi:HD superfamily phosphohydrolase
MRDAVFEFNRYHQHEMDIIDSPLIQRLRNIFQTSLAALVYPCSNHSRFEHSLSCVELAEKMASALQQREKDLMDSSTVFELRLAALLHDCGHGPFSHASEYIYQDSPIFEELRRDVPEVFGNPKNGASEVLSYFIVTSSNFKLFWKRVKNLYKDDKKYYAALQRVDLDRVGLMILGKSHKFAGRDKYYLDQIINGPFDVDKIDYIHRDGYFTGLGTYVDFARLLETVHTMYDPKTKYRSLAVDISGATCLEQLLFSKMLLFAIVYHHHKVRSAFLGIKSLFERMKLENWNIRGLSFDCPTDYLRVDDYDILGGIHEPAKFQQHVEEVKNRVLFKSALVLAAHTVRNDGSMERLLSLGENPKKIDDMRSLIAGQAGLKTHEVHIDVPSKPHFHKVGERAWVRISQSKTVPLEDIFPTAGWVTAYSQNRYRAYVFAPPTATKMVARTAAAALWKEGIKLLPDSFELAKHSRVFANRTLRSIRAIHLN